MSFPHTTSPATQSPIESFAAFAQKELGPYRLADVDINESYASFAKISSGSTHSSDSYNTVTDDELHSPFDPPASKKTRRSHRRKEPESAYTYSVRRLSVANSLYSIVDKVHEDREIVTIAMNYLDRFVISKVNSLNALAIDTPRGAATRSSTNDSAVTQSRSETKTKFTIVIYALAALDLAIKLHSPHSGDAFRCAFAKVASSPIASADPGATIETALLDYKYYSKSAASRSGSSDHLSHGRRQRNLPSDTHIKFFLEQVRKEFYGDEIYKGDYFTTIRAVSLHDRVQDFSEAQLELMHELDYRLHPCSASTFINMICSFLKQDFDQVDKEYTLKKGDIRSTEELVSVMATFQVELGVMHPKTCTARASLLAISAVSNAIRALLPRKCRTSLINKLNMFSRTTVGIQINVIPGNNGCITSSPETRPIRRVLYAIWVENSKAPKEIMYHDKNETANIKDFEVPRTKRSIHDRIDLSKRARSESTQFRGNTSPDTVAQTFIGGDINDSSMPCITSGEIEKSKV
ncbi:predicted protein [Chaetoceros tenuissimus]|uniref:Uncharacterized protein n=1 Tax=Chaetoceros tenuissimus TaxID=426638 RepID=A0AAD3CI18_9STRA|nr:predicted protein [Chaetoceros tenuissimus]